MVKWLRRFFNLDCVASNYERDKVLDYINKNGSITPDQAAYIGIKHLRSVVCRMKKNGKAIVNINKLGIKAEYKLK